MTLVDTGDVNMVRRGVSEAQRIELYRATRRVAHPEPRKFVDAHVEYFKSSAVSGVWLRNVYSSHTRPNLIPVSRICARFVPLWMDREKYELLASTRPNIVEVGEGKKDDPDIYFLAMQDPEKNTNRTWK
jgi:hypothetical protein